MKVLVAGTGAIGASFGSQLLKAGNDVTFLDLWDKAVEAVNQNGLYVTDVDKEEHFDVKFYFPHEVGTDQDFDLAIIAVKSHGLKNLLDKVKHLISPKTKVLCLLNGLGHIHKLKQYFKPEQIIMGVTVVTAQALGPGRFKLLAHNPTEVAVMDEAGKEKTLEIVEEFNKATMPFKYSDNVMWSIWRKACLNGSVNCVCALTNSTIRQQSNFPESELIVTEICKEFSQAAKLDNVDIDATEMKDYVLSMLLPTFPGIDHYPSMHQDLVTNKRLTEIDYLNGYVARRLNEAGLRAPYCELISALIRGVETNLGVRK